MAPTLSKQRQEIGQRLKSERERLGYTEIQIAQLIGIPLDTYKQEEAGLVDPGIFCMPRLGACGFDVYYIISGERYKPVPEENELLRRFRELSARGRGSIFMTLDALERLAPNLKERFQKKWRGD